MKKVILLFLTLFIMLTSTCFAAYTPDPNRWTWINSTDTRGTFWDKTTAQYTHGGNTVEFWVCDIYPQENAHVITRCKITKNPRTYTELQYTSYNSSTREIIKSKTYTSYEQKAKYIHPCGWEEELYEAVFSIKYPELKERLKNLCKSKNDKGTITLDTATLHYSSNGNVATYWIVLRDNVDFIWILEEAHKHDRTSAVLCIDDSYIPEKEYHRIIPGSVGEFVFNAIFPK